MSTSCALKNSPYLSRPVRTMWQAALALLAEGVEHRCQPTWDLGVRAWLLASASRAVGEPFDLTSHRAPWLP